MMLEFTDTTHLFLLRLVSVYVFKSIGNGIYFVGCCKMYLVCKFNAYLINVN